MSTTTSSGDGVDRIVGAWRHERPDLDVTPLAVLSRVSRLARRLDLARGEAFADVGKGAPWQDYADALLAARAPR